MDEVKYMRVQLITNRGIDNNKYPNITISELGTPRSLDEFDVNVIDLGTSDLWKTKGKNKEDIVKILDFKSLRSMVTHRQSATIIYSFPQDMAFLSYNSAFKQYQESSRLKDMLLTVKNIIHYACPDTSFPFLLYEKTTTKIGSESFDADFHFDTSNNAITVSAYSNKATTIKQKDYLFLTTLNITRSEELLFEFLNGILPKHEQEEIPEWMDTIDCFDDSALKHGIDVNKQIIENAQNEIDISKNKLQKNMYYKSILYTNGSELVEVVFKVLEKILSCDLSKFVDEKKADFIIKKDNYTLIGEIKGVTSNIKNEHISQVDVHYQGYMDKLSEEGTQENVHQILIMNPFRNKPLDERDPVSDDQINLAKRNECLIIETKTLLKLFEMFVAGKIDVDYCEDLFVKEIGLLTL